MDGVVGRILFLSREGKDVLFWVPTEKLFLVGCGIAEERLTTCLRVIVVKVVDLDKVLFVEFVLTDTAY